MRDPRTLHRTARLVSLSAALLLVAASVCPLLADNATIDVEASWVAPPHHSSSHGDHGECHNADCDEGTVAAKRCAESNDLSAALPPTPLAQSTLGASDPGRAATARPPDPRLPGLSPPLTC